MFKDVPESHPAYHDIMLLFKEGIVKGDGNGFYNPEANITMAKMAHIIARVIEKYKLSITAVPHVKKAVVVLRHDTGLGSGVFVSPDGHIITNHHVVKGYKTVGVLDEGGMPNLEGQVIAVSNGHDLALVKVDYKPPVYLKIAENDVVDGDYVGVVGHPKGYTDTFTDGRVSHPNRATSPISPVDCFQTDAHISPGNSGGLVFNGKSELCGVVVAKYTGIDVEGMGFCIHVRFVKEFLRQCGVSI